MTALSMFVTRITDIVRTRRNKRLIERTRGEMRARNRENAEIATGFNRV